MIRFVALATLLSSALWTAAATAQTVDCDAGQSLNRTLAKMDKFTPATVTVKGTCTEFVLIDGFHDLTVQAVQGATLQQPGTNPRSLQYVLSIKGSQGITVAGLAVHSQPPIFSGIGIGGGSTDVRLQHVTTDGSWGVVVYEASQVWLVKVTVNLTSGYAAISAFDKSDVHIVDGLLKRPSNGAFNAGLLVGSGHVTMQGMTIRDMQQSININGSGSVDLVNFDPTAAGIDVIIDNPSGTNFNGAIVSGSSSLNLGSAKLRITNAGQPWGGDTGAVFVSNGSTLNAASNLVISGSQGQGVIVSNNSHAELGGSSITGGTHGGLVVLNLSTATADQSNPLTVISANGTDLFCDSKSQIAGALNIANASVVQCNNLLPGIYESLP
ncbi:MAG TPA: hypothetical protein VNW47_16915 [Terriglobales bacterium]|jgi:hypothetical protein|nr:hypothetical protein [Terriglobales bacterium]